MPTIIRQALTERVRRDPELRRVLADLSAATGLRVSYASALGVMEGELADRRPEVCVRVRAEAAGCRMCERFHLSLLEQAMKEPCTARCDAGLDVSVVPLRAAGQTLGYLECGGHAAEPASTLRVNRARHLLARAGVALGEAELAGLLAAVPVVPAERQAAVVNVMAVVARHLTARIDEQLARLDTPLPHLVVRACAIVRAEYAHPVKIKDVARRLGASEGHLSRTFHRATGLRFVEYVSRWRAERARACLRETERTVAEIAFACGFQSLSQFNRVFQARYGASPRQIRAAGRSGGDDGSGSAA